MKTQPQGHGSDSGGLGYGPIDRLLNGIVVLLVVMGGLLLAWPQISTGRDSPEPAEADQALAVTAADPTWIASETFQTGNRNPNDMAELRVAEAGEEAPLPEEPWEVDPNRLSAEGNPPSAAESAPAPAAMEASTLLIPALGIYAPIVADEPVIDGYLQIPDNPAEVARAATSAALNAQQGTTLIAGHVSVGRVRGALWRLSELGHPDRQGTLVYTTDATGVQKVWAIYAVEVRDQVEHPDLFQAFGPRRLALVTCGGRTSDGQFPKNVVVLAAPAAEVT